MHSTGRLHLSRVALLQNWYEVNGRRIAKQELVKGQLVKTLYLYDGWDIIAVMNGQGQLLESYTRGVGLAGDIGTIVAVTHHAGSGVTPGTYYVHHNHRGDVIITRSGTTTVGSYDYSAFGNLKSSIGNDICRFKFSSKERDLSSGLYYYGYRFYAPQWQRWISADNIRESGGFNLHAVVRNNPIQVVDPEGSQPVMLGTNNVPWIPPFPSHPASCDKNQVLIPNCSGNAPPACPAKPPRPCTEPGATRNQKPSGSETKDCPGYGKITVNCSEYEKCMFWSQGLNGGTQYSWQNVRECPCPKPPESKE